MDGAAEREPARYRPLLVASLALIAGGAVATTGALAVAEGTLGDVLADGGADRGVALLGWLFAGALAFLVGLLAHAARSIVVRAGLPPDRYRGPSILVMLVIAFVAANLAIVPAAGDVAALIAGDPLSPLAALALLTATPLGLLGVTAFYVGAPRALAGLRLVPGSGLWRSVGLGLVLAAPAWIGAQLVGAVVLLLLQRVGLEPGTSVVEQAVTTVDPVVIVITVVFIGPIAEEVFFRGVVYNAWLREYGPRFAIAGSAILFGLIHGSVFLFLPIAGLGVALALLYRATGSLPAAIALHVGYNAITVALVLLDRFGVFDLPIT